MSLAECNSNRTEVTRKSVTNQQHKIVEPIKPLPFSSITYFSNENNASCLGVLITLKDILTDRYCSEQIRIIHVSYGPAKLYLQ